MKTFTNLGVPFLCLAGVLTGALLAVAHNQSRAFWDSHPFALAAFVMLIALLLLSGWWYMFRLTRRVETAEKALDNQIEFKQALLNGIPHPLYIRDREGRMITCNASYLEFFNFTREEVIGRRTLDMPNVDPVLARLYYEECMAVMGSGQPLMLDRRILTRHGNEITIFQWLRPYRDSEGQVMGVISGWHDISEREHLLQEAQDANRAKTTFFATLSHEIRTPMNAVIGMLELALKKADQGVLDRVAIEVASDAAHNLLELISDILDVARMESGRLTLVPEPVNLQAQIEYLLSLFDGMARQKQLMLIPHLSADADCEVLLDSLRFQQIMSNLLSNAIKFTQEGEVRLVVDAHANYERNRLSVRLLVEDTGSGISVEDQARLFQPFVQAGNNVQQGPRGSGLGLVISRNLCEMMGGHLRMSSRLGQGTQVEVQLEMPILEPVAPTLVPCEELVEQASVLSVLVVDDYPANRLLMAQQLAYLGHRSEDAENGARGLSAWRNGRFDVVITDCNMPIVDGYDMARAIRDEERKRGLTPCLILGFTASVHADEKQRCLDAGMNDCLAKPLSLRVLSEHLGHVELPNPPPAQSGVHTQEGRINLASLRLLTRGDEQSLNSLLMELAASNEEDLAQLATLYNEQNLLGLGDLAHRIRGGARIIKAKWLIGACEALEAVCRLTFEPAPEVLEDAMANVVLEMTAIADVLELQCQREASVR
ncbi:response regulator [Pseudomonas tolaasii]|uniref:ATP-binding protein n=1 Tax=Pseudomonas tolaasii TaxID=29442 RepID=UPI001C58A678|nr:ATP-binding protein [Pseudomonas tolaasii]MBW1250808.1 response regulator [Pseudomonas tolaasii]